MKEIKKYMIRITVNPNEKFGIELIRSESSIQDVAKRIGMSRASLSIWVNRNKQPGISKKKIIESCMNMKVCDWDKNHVMRLNVKEMIHIVRLRSYLTNIQISRFLRVTTRTITNIIRNEHLLSNKTLDNMWEILLIIKKCTNRKECVLAIGNMRREKTRQLTKIKNNKKMEN